MTASTSVLDQILDLARWAPSGDNVQPWRFEVMGSDHVRIHALDTFETRRDCVYDLDGRPTQMSLGALIETLSIAASGFGLRAEVSRPVVGAADTQAVFDVHLRPDASVQPSALIDAIPRRSVQRRPFSTRPLTAAERQALQAALLPGFSLRIFEGAAARWKLALLMFHSAKIRLTTEEAYRVHRDIIAWGRRYSPDRVPDQSLGADPVALKFMRWAMADWQRVRFMNRYFAGTWVPRLQLDLLPAFACGAHLALVRAQAPASIDDYVESGRCVQRLWLTVTRLGLQHQPEITPLIFSRFDREGRRFTTEARALERAQQVRRSAEALIGPDLAQVVWLARVGQGRAAQARSQRRGRHELTLPASAAAAATPSETAQVS